MFRVLGHAKGNVVAPMIKRLKHDPRMFVCIFLVLNLGGCTGRTAAPQPSRETSHDAGHATGVDNSPYVLQVGDVIDVKLFYNPELNDRVTIRPDGRISLQLVDEVDAAGLTPAELDEILTDAYAQLLQNPDVAVIVREFASQQVYVGGEVVSPGVVPLRPRMTALEAVVGAGGFRETAEPRSVIILSSGPDNTRLAREVDLNDVLKGRQAAGEHSLRPFDVVYVPKTLIAEVNKFVDQYINGIIPDGLSAGFSYTRYRGTQTGRVETTPLP